MAESTVISSTEAVRNLGDLLARVRYRGERFILTRNDLAVAELGPVVGSRRASWREVKDAVKGLPCDSGFADDLAKVNAMDRPEESAWS